MGRSGEAFPALESPSTSFEVPFDVWLRTLARTQVVVPRPKAREAVRWRTVHISSGEVNLLARKGISRRLSCVVVGVSAQDRPTGCSLVYRECEVDLLSVFTLA